MAAPTIAGYPATKTQYETALRQSKARRGKPMTPCDEWRIADAQAKRLRRHRSAD